MENATEAELTNANEIVQQAFEFSDNPATEQAMKNFFNIESKKYVDRLYGSFLSEFATEDQDALIDLLGSDGYAVLKDYKKDMLHLADISDFKAELGRKDMSLTEQQSEELTSILGEVNGNGSEISFLP